MDYKMIVTPEQSRAVQEACFANGIEWNSGHRRVTETDIPYLYVNGNILTCGTEGGTASFGRDPGELITPEDFIEMLNQPKPHPHAELMMQYAQDAAETYKPWKRWQYKRDCDDDWADFSAHPGWHHDCWYRRKPETIEVGRYEFPRPLRSAPAHGTELWVVSINYAGAHVYASKWRGDDMDQSRLAAGICHLTEEAAQKHAAALNAINRGDV